MRILTTLLLTLLAILMVTAAVFLAVDGNLARLTGWYRFQPGSPLFSEENLKQLDDVCWMRIEGLHDRIECQKEADGTWWIVTPFRDRLSPAAVQAILTFTAKARVVDTLPLNKMVRGSMREFGVETTPNTITLKVPAGEHDLTTIARYTLGSASPWLADAGDGESLLPTTYLRTNFYGRDKRIHVVSGNILSLFRDGLEALRDPRPLLFSPEQLRRIEIQGSDGEKPLILQRVSAEAAWNIVSPGMTGADQDKVNGLAASLSRLTAQKVEDAEDVELSGKPIQHIRLHLEGKEQPIVLHLYPPYPAENGEQVLCHATVDDRPVVFTLQAEPRVKRKGSYSRLINAVCSLPVLPEKAMSRILTGERPVYVGELPLELEKLRSMRFSDIEARDVERVSLRSRFARWPLRLLLIPGDEESGVQDTWMFSAAGQRYQEAEPAVVQGLLRALGQVPVDGFVEDVPPGEDVGTAARKYGLHAPDYVLSVLPRPCAVRAVLFGQDMPLVRDRSPRTFFIKRYEDSRTEESYWVGIERGTRSIYRLSPRLTRHFSFSVENWKLRNIVHFPLSAVRRLTLGFQQAPLVLDYDYIGESWTGTLDGEDVTPRINPHRAENYVRHLQKLKAFQWLDRENSSALRALQHPVFSVRIDLEMTDYSDAETVVIDQPTDVNEVTLAETDGSSRKLAEKLLQEGSDTDAALRKLALAERKTHRMTLTIEIAPSELASDTPFFYGRVRETGDMFILPFEEAQGLAGSILDM